MEVVDAAVVVAVVVEDPVEVAAVAEAVSVVNQAALAANPVLVVRILCPNRRNTFDLST